MCLSLARQSPAQSISFDLELIRRYDQQGPRYTSYPTANQFSDQFKETHYRAWARSSNEDPIPRPLSIYVHIPFCDTVCFYCACNKIITGDHGKAEIYLAHLHREITLQGELFDRDRPVFQLHFGGGTPTFLSSDQLQDVFALIRKNFNIEDENSREYSIEVDPRSVDVDEILALEAMGFNRISFGVQDLDPVVQKAVNRIQSEDQTLEAIDAARNAGFQSISVDLIYGLPFQTVEGFRETLRKIKRAEPDRVCVFNYAHLPKMFNPQRRIKQQDLPTPDTKLEILKYTVSDLMEAGYLYIGMDHFAIPDDDLAIAQANGSLCRNFQGYSTHTECDLVGIGLSSIGSIGDCYSQNTKHLDEYYRNIDDGEIPITRGRELNFDDLLRREVIQQLMCRSCVKIEAIEHAFEIRFWRYFDHERPALEAFEADRLLTADGAEIRVSASGRLLIRNICMVFDRYLGGAQPAPLFSRMI